MKMYADYIKEREGISLFQHAHGFATYEKIDENQFYLIDIYVEPEFRKSGIGKEISAEIAKIAKKEGASKLIGSVCLNANGVTISLKAILGDGFKYSHARGDMIYFVKDI